MAKEICPYCGKDVLKDDPDRMIIYQSVIVAHGTCRKIAIENIIRRSYLVQDYRERN